MKKILVIDDQPDNLISIKAIIKSYMPEFQVITALSGMQGIELARNENPDTILLDINMPEMDGYEVCRKLKREESISHIPIVMITAIKTDSESRIRGLELGADAFLSKPIDPPELTAQLKVMLRIKESEDQIRAEKAILEETVLKRTDKLKVSEERFKVVTESAEEWVWEVNPDGLYTYSSPVVEKILGITSEEIVGKKHFYDLFQEDVKEQLKVEAFKTFQQKLVFKNFENPNLHKNGQVVILKTSGSPILDNEGNLVGYRGVDVDITERIKSEFALINSEAKLAAMISNISDVIAIIDEQGLISYKSPNIKDLFGWEPQELVGKSAFTTVHDDDKNRIQNEFYKLFEKQNSNVNVEFNYMCKDGTYRTVQCTAVNLLTNPQINGILLNYHDITESKQAELNLRKKNENIEESERLLKESQKVAHLGSYAWDLSTNLWKSSVILDEIFGIDENYNRSLEGWTKIIHPEGQQIMTDYVVDEVIGKKQKFDKEYQIIRKNDGEVRWVHGLGILEIDNNNHPVKLVGTISDITERKKTELLLEEKNEHIESQNKKLIATNSELIIAKERAEESDRLKSAFLTNMSHEIRTPMNGILGFVELLQDPEISKKEQKEFFDIVTKSGDRLLNTINDIIEISKIEAGQNTIHYSDENVKQIMNDQFNFFYREAEMKGIKLILSFGDIDNALIKTDKNKLESILSNLVKNAIKFTNNGAIELGYTTEKEVITFFVKDSGVGIVQNRLDAIFNRFEQADLSISRGHEGSGLGLTIAKAYVEMLGGKIWVESELGKGSTFYFTTDYVQQVKNQTNREQNKVTQVEKKTFSNRTILVAEDDEISFLLIETILVNQNCKLLRAENGKKAIEIFKNNSEIELVLMDLKMPVMDGIKATREIRQMNNSIPIIAQTAYALSGEKEIAIEAGCNDYITKPVKRNELLKLLQKYS